MSPTRPPTQLDHTQLRPTALDDFVGQEQLKGLLSALITNASTVPHSLLTGPAGHGKTTLAGIIANELGMPLTVVAAPSIDRKDGLIEPLLAAGGVIFFDEIHRLKKPIQEVLFPAMEDGVLHYSSGKQNIMMPLREGLIILAATTNPGSLLKPLLDRFTIQLRFQPYKTDEIVTLVQQSASRTNIEIDSDAVMLIAQRTRKNPRQANHALTLSCMLQPDKNEVLNEGHVNQTLTKFLGLDDKGLNNDDRMVLTTMVTQFSGEAVGIHALAAASKQESDYYLSQIEPFLLEIGFIERSSQGRKISVAGFEYLQEKGIIEITVD